MKITLISPYHDLNGFGIRTISSCLKRAGHQVDLVFLPQKFTKRYESKTLDEVVDLAKESNLVGVSLMTNYFENAVQITKKLKNHCDAPVLWGGIHPTVRPEECLNYADMVCMGEGEESVVELCKEMENGEGFYNVSGIWFKDRETIISNVNRPLVQNLDAIPFPDYDYGDHFLLHHGLLKQMNRELFEIHHGKNYMTLPTRGCPFGCSYCCNNTINAMYPKQKSLRKRSVDNIISELVSAKENLPSLKRIVFADDCFLSLSLDDVKEFSQEYKKNVDLPLLIGGAAPTTVNREKLSLLVDAGLDCIRMGIQTGSERTKKMYRRRHSNQAVEKSVKLINEHESKIKKPIYDVILDNPWERDEDLTDTLMFLSKLPTPYYLALFSLSFYPGTSLYEKAKTDGFISDDREDVYNKDFVNCKKTYLNDLFFLLRDHTDAGFRISPQTMDLLINHKMRNILKRLLRLRLQILMFPARIKRFKFLFQKGLKTIKKGQWSRINWYLRKTLLNHEN